MGMVVLGSTFVDIKGYPLGDFDPKGRNAGTIEQVHGGVGHNVVEDLANIGLKPAFVSLVDLTGTGSDVLKRLEEHGVDTRYIRRTPDGMGTWLVIFDSQGDLAASISKRPDLTPIYELLKEKGDEIIAGADSVALEIDMEQETVDLVFELAEKYHKKVFTLVSNMTIAMERRKMIRKSACFICNQQEAGIFFGEDYEGRSPEEMVPILENRVKDEGLQNMVVTMGGEGAVYVDESGRGGCCPAMHVKVKDTGGAGDAFFAGVTAGLTYGEELASACGLGTKMAAAVIESSESVCPASIASSVSFAAPLH